jgi:2-methylcitrate dehydratase PrpD
MHGELRWAAAAMSARPSEREAGRLAASATSNIGASVRLANWILAVPRAWTAQGSARAADLVRDSFLCAASGAGDLAPVLDALDPGSGPCPVPGRRGLRVAREAAALAWGTAIHRRELDDQTYSMGGHLMCTVLPALIATRHGRATWEALFDAIVVACEVASRINRCMSRQHMEAGWVATTTYGLIAATAALARIEGFDRTQTLAALALAANKAFGAKNPFGTPAKAVNAGLAARDAVTLARLARAGITAAADPLEGDYGFGRMYRGRYSPQWDKLFPPGDDSPPAILTGAALKKHACCASSHRCVDALLALRSEYGFGAEEVEQVTALVGPLNYLTLRYPEPLDAMQAQFSMQFILATALRYGEVGPADFSAAAVQDLQTRALMPRIDLQLLPAASAPGFVETTPLPHRVQVKLIHRAQLLTCSVLHPRGSPGNPFDERDWTVKSRQCLDGVVPDAQARAIESALADLDRTSLDELVALLAGFDCDYDPDGSRFRRENRAGNTLK